MNIGFQSWWTEKMRLNVDLGNLKTNRLNILFDSEKSVMSFSTVALNHCQWQSKDQRRKHTTNNSSSLSKRILWGVNLNGELFSSSPSPLLTNCWENKSLEFSTTGTEWISMLGASHPTKSCIKLVDCNISLTVNTLISHMLHFRIRHSHVTAVDVSQVLKPSD